MKTTAHLILLILASFVSLSASADENEAPAQISWHREGSAQTIENGWARNEVRRRLLSWIGRDTFAKKRNEEKHIYNLEDQHLRVLTIVPAQFCFYLPQIEREHSSAFSKALEHIESLVFKVETSDAVIENLEKLRRATASFRAEEQEIIAGCRSGEIDATWAGVYGSAPVSRGITRIQDAATDLLLSFDARTDTNEARDQTQSSWRENVASRRHQTVRSNALLALSKLNDRSASLRAISEQARKITTLPRLERTASRFDASFHSAR